MATAGDRRGPGPERAYVVTPLPASGRVALDAEESRHLVRSRRVGAGETVVLFDGRGGSVVGRLVRADPREALVEIDGPYPAREPGRTLVLAVSLPEAGRADRFLGTLAELGVARVVPLMAARTPAGRDALPRRRGGRWSRILREAAKVSGRSRLMEVGETVPFGRLVAEHAPGLVLLDPDPACEALARRLPAEGPLPVLAVGPEGGFRDDEVDEAQGAGASRARIGASALRIETAAIAAAAIALGG